MSALLAVRWCLPVLAVQLTLFAARTQAQTNVVELTVEEIEAGYAAGSFTAVELTKAFLDRIDTFEHNYNAFTSFAPDALTTAATLDEELRTTGSRGPLHGVPVVIKEAMDVRGLPSTMGFAEFSSQVGGTDLFPAFDATVVSRLRDAGAIILGKTNVPSFSLDGTRANSSWDGPTYNAYDRRLAPGASSAGTATAVAGSFAVVGLAEETGGSIQNPAAAQSLVGIKPTFGLVPTSGVMPLGGSTRDVVGPHAKTVYDAAVTLDAIAGFSDEDANTMVAIGKTPEGGYRSQLSSTALEGTRLGLFGPGWSSDNLSGETAGLYQASLDALRTEGATLVDDPFAGTGFASLSPQFAFDDRGLESIVFDFEKYLERFGLTAGPVSLDELKELTGVDLFSTAGPLSFFRSLPVALESINDPDAPPDLSAFAAARSEMLQVFHEVMDQHQLEALVFPQATGPPPYVLGSESISATTVSEINILGTPGVTVPAGYHADGAPFSLIFLGKEFTEAELLGYAFDFEQATHARVAPELLAAYKLLPTRLTQLSDRDRDGNGDVATDRSAEATAALGKAGASIFRLGAKYVLPALQAGETLEQATLRVQLTRKSGDPSTRIAVFHGLTDDSLESLASTFEDAAYEDTLVDLIVSEDPAGEFLEVDITDWLRMDYAREPDGPVAALRFQLREIVGDDNQNYRLAMPGVDFSPELTLHFVPEPGSLSLLLMVIALGTLIQAGCHSRTAA